MDFGLSSLNSFLGSNPALAKLANNAVSNFTSSPKPAPVLVTQSPAAQSVQVAQPGGMSTGKMVGIGAAVLAVVVLMVVVLKRK